MNAAIASPALHCPNSHCMHPNAFDRVHCEACNTRLVRRLLRVVGPLPQPPVPGQLLGNRYQWVGTGDDRIVLDTQPGMTPALVETVPDLLLPYLRLLPQRLAVPQIYGFVYRDDLTLFLLEDVPVRAYIGPQSPAHSDSPKAQGQLLPTLQDQWATSSLQRQLGWLWQMSNLWLALAQHKVAATLLNPELVRVDGPVLRLLELQLIPATPTLEKLADLWETLLPTSNEQLQPFLQKIITLIHSQDLRYPHPLSQLLQQAVVQANPGRDCVLTIATQTDAGPSRQNNEDSCFPPSHSSVTGQAGGSSLAIVCDGLGGHEGGEVASSMAVQILQEQLQSLTNADTAQNPLYPIQRAITQANDAISSRNNDEKRQERRRMGTTVVSALTLDPFTYIFHVGDSRAYWITPHNCRQITVDDDLAARHVALGFGLYRSVLQSPTSGALVQALGMSASVNLMPNIVPFFLDEEALLLLCSDGLSDNDLLERIWDEILLPGLRHPEQLAPICQRLVQAANTLNGHDNVTVALIHYKFQAPAPFDSSTLLDLLHPGNLNPQDLLTEPIQGRSGLEQEEEEITGFLPKTVSPAQAPTTAPETTDLGMAEAKPLSPLMWIWGLMVVAIAGTVIGAFLFSPFFNLKNSPDPFSSPLPSPNLTPSVPETSPLNVAPSPEASRTDPTNPDPTDPAAAPGLTDPALAPAGSAPASPDPTAPN